MLRPLLITAGIDSSGTSQESASSFVMHAMDLIELSVTAWQPPQKKMATHSDKISVPGV
jgi:hypothetical protein